MRDPIDEAFREWNRRQTKYEADCPECQVCGQKITNTDYYYDVDGEYICDNYDCIMGYLRPFKKSVEDFISNRRD